MKKKKGKKGAGGDGKRQVTNLREAPYSLKDGDVIAVVDRQEDPEGQADLTRADDEVSVGDGSVAVLLFYFSFDVSFKSASIYFHSFFVRVIVFWHFFRSVCFCQFVSVKCQWCWMLLLLMLFFRFFFFFWSL